MTLRNKTLGIIGIMLIALVGALFATSVSVFLKGFLQVEQDDTHKNILRAVAAYDAELANLSFTTLDWASWDDTYAFIEDENATYRTRNINDEGLARLGLNVLIYINASGRMVFGASYDPTAARSGPIPEGLRSYLAPGALLLQHPEPDEARTGVLLLPQGPLLVASRPILPSLGEGASRGTLLMGRYLNAQRILQLESQTQADLEFQRLDVPSLADDFKIARAKLLTGAPSLIRPLSGATIAGYSLLRDVNDQPALLLRVSLPRDIYRQGVSTTRYQLTWLLFAALLLGGGALLALERMVIAPLRRLEIEAASIRGTHDIKARVSVSGNDEISGVATEINRMLDESEQTEIQHRRAVEQLAEAKAMQPAARPASPTESQ
jgi:sensor domain CHASE-containing protein